MRSNANQERDQLSSRLGFILLSAGCAIGCGNVWKFPWLAGQYGGGAFVLIYLIFLLILGLPVITMEFSLGRAAQKSPLFIYKALQPKGTHWAPLGIFSLIGNVCLMMFYTVVTGWMLYYFIQTAAGSFNGLNQQAVGAAFGKSLASPSVQVIYTWLVVLAGFFICSFSLKKGVERVTKWMMSSLMVVMFALAIHSLYLDGAAAGMKFYLLPDFKQITWDVVVAAMNQAFFTLSIGIGSMAIFGSYIGKDRALMGEGTNVILLDTIVALTAGVIIFPACYTYGVQADAGPGLIFVTLPSVFNHMAGGQFWGALFFIFMCFAALTTVLAVFENILACVKEITGWTRARTSWVCCAAMLILTLPCALGFNAWSGFQPMGRGTCVLDLEDFIVSNCLLPLGSLLYVIFCTQSFGWGWRKFRAEANEGKGSKVPNWAQGYCTYVLPLIILVVFTMGIIPLFK